MAKDQGPSSPILKRGEGANLGLFLSQKLYYVASNEKKSATPCETHFR